MTLPETLEKSPRIALYIEEMRAVLERERPARDRYYAESGQTLKAEFINGEVIVTPPLRLEHADCQKLLLGLLNAYVTKNGLGYVGHEELTVHLTRNDYEPDIAFWRSEVARGFKRGQVKFPPPDLAVEILSDSTEARDRGIKMDDYAAHGVREYWLVDADKQMVEQYFLHGDAFALATKSGSGDLTSSTVAGFALPIVALFDSNANLETLKAILLG